MGKRIVTGVFSAVLLIALLYLGGIAFEIALCVISVIGCKEFISAFRNQSLHLAAAPLLSASVLMFPAYYFASFTGAFLLFVATGIAMLLTLFFREKPNYWELAGSFHVILTLFIPLLLLLHLMQTEPLYYGTMLVTSVFVIALISDIFAYFIGVLFGTHKMIPQLSPNKTWEGSAAGIVGSTVGALLLCHFGNLLTPMPPLWHFAILGVVGGMVGQLGDLLASMVKRYCGIKDYGSIFPGHGGMLDRLDSVLLVAYVVFAYTLIVV